jgi:peptide deformylase
VAQREVLLYPDPILKEVAAPAQPGDLDRVGEDLLDTMRSFQGCVGLAAPQLGELVRLIAVDVSEHPKAETSNGLLLLANPRVVASDGSEVAREGCLSIPDMTANVRRATTITVEHNEGRVECQGFEARCVLHELDHLDGVLFLDRVESLVDDVFRRKRYAPPPDDRKAAQPSELPGGPAPGSKSGGDVEPGTGSSSGEASDLTG